MSIINRQSSYAMLSSEWIGNKVAAAALLIGLFCTFLRAQQVASPQEGVSASGNTYLDPYRAIVDRPDHTIRVGYQTASGIDSVFEIRIVRNIPAGAPGGMTLTPAAERNPWFYGPMFFLEERVGELPLPDGDKLLETYRKSAPPVIRKMTTDGKVISVEFAFNNEFSDLRTLADDKVHWGPHGYRPATRPSDAIRPPSPVVQVLPVTDAFVRFYDRQSQALIATGYTQGILLQRGSVPFTVLFTPQNLQRFIDAYSRDELQLIWYYRYSNISASFLKVNESMELDLASAIESTFSLAQRNGKAPILLGDVNTFNRNIEARVLNSFQTNDPALLPLVTQFAMNQVTSQVFTAEQQLSLSDFAKKYPGAEQSLAEYLRPQIEQVTNSKGNVKVDVETKQTGIEASTSTGVAGTTGYVTMGGSAGVTYTQLEQLQKTTGVTLQETSSKERWEIQSISVRGFQSGVQKVRVQGGHNGVLLNEPNAGYITLTALPPALTVQKVAKQFQGMLAEQAKLAVNGSARDTLEAECTRYQIEIVALRTSLKDPPPLDLAGEFDQYLLRTKKLEGLSGRTPTREEETAIQSEFYKVHAGEQRKTINELRLRGYELEKATYAERVKHRESAIAYRQRVIDTINKPRYSRPDIGNNRERPGDHKGFWVRLQDHPSRRFDLEEHFVGIVTFFGGRPDNIAMMIAKPGAEPRRSGRLMEGNTAHADNTGVELKLSSSAVINSPSSSYYGDDFDGWSFTTTEGLLNVRLGGNREIPYPRNDPVDPDPKWSEKFEWELCGIKVEGGAWIDHADLEFRVCFRDRTDSIPEIPPVIPEPKKPPLFDTP